MSCHRETACGKGAVTHEALSVTGSLYLFSFIKEKGEAQGLAAQGFSPGSVLFPVPWAAGLRASPRTSKQHGSQLSPWTSPAHREVTGPRAGRAAHFILKVSLPTGPAVCGEEGAGQARPAGLRAAPRGLPGVRGRAGIRLYSLGHDALGRDSSAPRAFCERSRGQSVCDRGRCPAEGVTGQQLLPT